MEQVAVIHTAFEDKPSTVAFVEVPNDAESTIDKLEFAYRWTQNIMDRLNIEVEDEFTEEALPNTKKETIH